MSCEHPPPSEIRSDRGRHFAGAVGHPNEAVFARLPTPRGAAVQFESAPDDLQRITVDFIPKLVSDGYAAGEIVREYPELERDDVLQAARYGAWLASERTNAVE